MNLSRTAIRYELSCGSAAILLRLYLRIQLLWIFIWAASDLFFVWYWTRRVSAGRPGILRPLDSCVAVHPEGPALLPIAPLPRQPVHDREHVPLPELALLSGVLVRGAVRLIQHLGSGTGDPDSRRARLLLAPRSR